MIMWEKELRGAKGYKLHKGIYTCHVVHLENCWTFDIMKNGCTHHCGSTFKTKHEAQAAAKNHMEGCIEAEVPLSIKFILEMDKP